MIEVRNVGPGPAGHVDVKVVYQPRDDRDDVERQSSRVTSPLMAPEDFVRMIFPDPDPRGLLTVNDLVDRYSSIRLVGTYKDVLGHEYEADEVWTDLALWCGAQGPGDPGD